MTGTDSSSVLNVCLPSLTPATSAPPRPLLVLPSAPTLDVSVKPSPTRQEPDIFRGSASVVLRGAGSGRRLTLRSHVCYPDERTPLRCRGYLVHVSILLIKPVEAESAAPCCLRAARLIRCCLFRSARPPQLGNLHPPPASGANGTVEVW